MDRLTIPEYDLLVEALRYREVDQDYRNHQQAYLNFLAKATKASGKKMVPVYKSFRKFYDYEAELEKLSKKESEADSRFSGLREIIMKGKDDG